MLHLYKCKIFIALTDFIFPLQLMLFFYFFINLAPAKGTNYFPVFRIRIPLNCCRCSIAKNNFVIQSFFYVSLERSKKFRHGKKGPELPTFQCTQSTSTTTRIGWLTDHVDLTELLDGELILLNQEN